VGKRSTAGADSFSVTFLGHHGWVFTAGRSTLLVDPLLGDGFGHTPAVGLRVYPPRAFSLGRFPPVTALFLTHEHEGHFDLPSLARLDRAIPVYLPERSSQAMRDALRARALGFRRIHVTLPGDLVRVGALRLLPLPSDQLNDAIIDEWDSTAYLVYDRDGHGSFFSHVDMPISEGMRQLVRATLGKPPVAWARTNNFHDCYFQQSWGRPLKHGLGALVGHTLQEHRAFTVGSARPQALLLAGGGFAFPPKSPINRNAFVWNSEQAANALAALLPDERVLAAQPGHTLVMKDGALARVSARTPYVRSADHDRWPDRSFRGNVRWLASYAPTTGRKTPAAQEWAELQHELDELARFLYGRQTFKSLCSLGRAELKGRRATFAIAALSGARGRPTVFAYEPHACRFRRVDDAGDPYAAYLATYECWATDLLATLRAQISPTALSFARSRVVNHLPLGFHFALNGELFAYAHPLRMPERFLALYRTVIAATAEPAAVKKKTGAIRAARARR
jgi:hypothetical protein